MNLKTRNDIYELMGAYLPSAALTAALETGLFWQLADGPKTGVYISQALHIPGKRCSYWLRLLVKMDLLIQDGDQFDLSPAARTAILDTYSQDAWHMLALDAQDNYQRVTFLARRLSNEDFGGNQEEKHPSHLPFYVQQYESDPERARFFTEMLFELHMGLAQAVTGTLELNGARKLLDVGGGSGVVSLALLRQHPQLNSLVVDIPTVCKTGREIAGKQPEGDRISYYEADFVRDELPQGFDIVLECDVGQFDNALLAKLASSLNEGGRLVIVDHWFDMGEQETPDRLAYLLTESLRNPDYSLRSLEDIEAGLSQAGLEVDKIVKLPYGAWQMIQARKGVPEGAVRYEQADLIAPSLAP